MKYLTIAEFADRAGVSRQSVYQRVNRNGLDEYLKIDDSGAKRISEEALKLYSNVKASEVAAETAHDASQALENEESAKDEYLTAEAIKSLQETVKTLQNVVDRQSEELKQKTEMLDERDKQIADYANKFAELAHNALQTAVQAQTLHAVSESDKFVNAPQNGSQNVTADKNVDADEADFESTSNSDVEQGDKRKLSWFTKLFSKH